MADRDIAALSDADVLAEVLKEWRDRQRRREQLTEISFGGNWLLGANDDGDAIVTNTETDVETVIATA